MRRFWLPIGLSKSVLVWPLPSCALTARELPITHPKQWPILRRLFLAEILKMRALVWDGRMTPTEIKAARKALGMTQAQLATALELAGSSGARTVRNWEQGRIAITGPARVAIRMMLALKSAFPGGFITLPVTRHGQVARIAKFEAERDALREALIEHEVKCADGDILTVADALETAAGTLMCFIDADEEAGSNGLRDCTDNEGCAYQSEFMAGLIDHARVSAADLHKYAAAFRAALAATSGDE